MNKLLLSFLPLFIFPVLVSAQSVGIGTGTPHPLAQLDVSSSSKGVLIPRLTQIEINTITAPPQGLLVFNTNTNSFQFHNGSQWNNIAHSGIVTGLNNRVPRFIGNWGLTSGIMLDNGSGVSINGGNPDASALLDMTSTSRGVLIPRMTSIERAAIVSPATGLLVFDNSTVTFWYFNGSVWMELGAGGGGGGHWSVLGNNIFNSNSGNVGIGSTTPPEKLSVVGNALVSGSIGVATATPDLLNYKMDINGNARTRLDQHVNRDLWVDRNLDVDGTSNLFGDIVAGQDISVGGNATIAGNVTVDGGRGIVRGTNSSQRVVAFPSGTVGYTNVPAGYTNDVEFALPNVFSSMPIVSIGQVTAASGAFGRFVMTIYDVDIVNHRFMVRFHCPFGYSGNATFTLHFIAIGTAL